jgi:hypothetical protein
MSSSPAARVWQGRPPSPRTLFPQPRGCSRRDSAVGCGSSRSPRGRGSGLLRGLAGWRTDAGQANGLALPPTQRSSTAGPRSTCATSRTGHHRCGNVISRAVRQKAPPSRSVLCANPSFLQRPIRAGPAHFVYAASPSDADSKALSTAIGNSMAKKRSAE